MQWRIAADCMLQGVISALNRHLKLSLKKVTGSAVLVVHHNGAQLTTVVEDNCAAYRRNWLPPQNYIHTESAAHLWVVSEGDFCGEFCGSSAESSRKFAKIRFTASGKSAEIRRKVCGNFAEVFKQISATTPSRTTPEVNC